ncbi:MAG TPA: multidrug RND transporter [Desulfobacterales bacterium]|nr:multidrug RND transporter [Desulfobacterales bacterium]
MVTIITIALAANLKLTTRWSDLLPLDDPIVREFDKIIKEYDTASNSIIVVRGPEKQIKAFADDIAPRIEQMTEEVKRVDYKLNRAFLEHHGLMLTKASDLKDMVDIFQDLSLIPLLRHINDNFEKTYVGSEENISTKEKEDKAVAFLDGIQFWLQTMDQYATGYDLPSEARADSAVERLLIGDSYLISQDKRMLLMAVEPTFSMLDTDRMMKHVDALQAILDERLPHYPEVEAGLTGMLPLGHDEMAYSMKDMQTTSVLAFVLVIALFIVSFRIWTAPILAGVNLLLGIIWAAGFGAIFLDSLNLFTQMFAVILIGVRIDYSIHIISVYHEMRYKGESLGDAVQSTLLKSGSGVITGALTTACAFFTLMISNSRGMKEMGLILRIGIISCMLSSLMVLPSLLVTREKVMAKLRKKEVKPVNVEFKFLGHLGHTFSHRPAWYLTVALICTVFFLYQALTVTFDYNYLNMEPKGIPSVTLQDEMIEAFDMSPDFALVTAQTVEEARQITEKAKAVSSVSAVESISNYLPSEEQQAQRTPYIAQIRNDLEHNRRIEKLSSRNFPALISELERLEMNVVELGQLAFTGGQDRVDRKCKSLIGEPEDSTSTNYILSLADALKKRPAVTIERLNRFQAHYEPRFRRMALRMANISPIRLETLPEDITGQFYNKTRDRFLITIIPKEKVWDFEFLNRFTDQMKRVSPHITGTPPMFLAWMDYIGRDGRIATMLTIVVVFVLLLLDFRSVRMALMAMIPLTFGAIWMVGLLKTIGYQLTFVNVMGIPMIVGLGIDDGVHFLHRVRIEGRGQIRIVASSTGKAIMLTSLTTIAGFGSLLIAKYRGLGSLGTLLVLGVGACFITTILILPSLLGWMERRQKVEESGVRIQ